MAVTNFHLAQGSCGAPRRTPRAHGDWRLDCDELVDYYTGQPFRVGAADPYWPLWGNIYPQFNLTGYKGPTNPGKYVPVGSSGLRPRLTTSTCRLP